MIDKLPRRPALRVRQIQWWRDTLKTGQPGMKTGNGRRASTPRRRSRRRSSSTTARTPTSSRRRRTPARPSRAARSPTASCTGRRADGGRPHRPGPHVAVLREHGLPPRALHPGDVRLLEVPGGVLGDAEADGRRRVHEPLGLRQHHRAAPTREDRLPGHVGRHLRELPHDDEPHRAAVRELRRERRLQRDDDPGADVPSPGTPKAALADWLPAERRPSRGATASRSPTSRASARPSRPTRTSRSCAVNRVWNYAMSRGDIVNDLATIPSVVTDPLVKDFTDERPEDQATHSQRLHVRRLREVLREERKDHETHCSHPRLVGVALRARMLATAPNDVTRRQRRTRRPELARRRQTTRSTTCRIPTPGDNGVTRSRTRPHADKQASRLAGSRRAAPLVREDHVRGARAASSRPAASTRARPTANSAGPALQGRRRGARRRQLRRPRPGGDHRVDGGAGEEVRHLRRRVARDPAAAKAGTLT